MHGGAPGSGAPKGNQNALKHGFYAANAIEERRRVSELLRAGRKLLEEAGGLDLGTHYGYAITNNRRLGED